jgi:hypothetical protein
VILAAEIGPPAHTGAQLRRGQRIGTVVGVEAGDLAVLNMGDEQAASAAVVGGAAHANQFFRGAWGRGFLARKKAHILSVEELRLGG